MEIMEKRQPVPGEFYQNTDGDLYQIRTLAIHSETEEKMVVYQKMCPPFQICVSSLSDFWKKIESEKYSEMLQDGKKIQKVDDTQLIRALESGQPERYLAGKITEKEIAERGFMEILDAPTFHEKRQLMIGLKQYLDKRLLNNIAVSLDIVLEEGELEEQYESVLHCIETMERYEGGRLR